MKLIFMRRGTVACWFIRWFTWSDWSHVAIQFGDRVYEAKAKEGVRKTTLDVALAGTAAHLVMVVRGVDDDQAEAFAGEQLGKPYDWTALVGMLMRRDIQLDDAWDCSEYGYCIALRGGKQLVKEPGNRITPQKLIASPWVEAVDG